MRVCLYVICGQLLGKGWPLGSRLWCLLWVCHFPIGILGQVCYLIVSIPDLCTLTYFVRRPSSIRRASVHPFVIFFFKRHLLLKHWSKCQITSQCSLWCPLSKLNTWFRSNEQEGRLLTTSPLDPLVQIQNDFTELFLPMHSTKITQMVPIFWTRGCHSSK